MGQNIFLKIIAGEIPCNKVYEDEEILAFRDIRPQAPVHVLIIPKREIPTLNDLRPEDAGLVGRLFLVAKQIAEQEGIAASGYRTVFNCGRDAGMEVPHLHLHLLGGRPLTWPPG
jgi:histidine triad (HIT) family protein